jgi:membrane protease YdiL (CAAX protease family)
MNNNPSAPILQSETPPVNTVPIRSTNWRQVITFLCLTFGLTWLLDLALYLNGGLLSGNVGLALQLQMLLPAFSALLLGVFFFKDSRVYFKSNHTASRWFIYFYFLLTLLYIAGFITSFILPGQAILFSQLLLIPSVVGLILLIVLRLVGGKNAFSTAGLGGGRPIVWLLLGLLLVAFYGLETLLNYLFKLGNPVSIASLYPPEAIVGMPVLVLLLSGVFNTILIGPFLGLIIAFGEEYGWRGYLQGELNHLGRVRGTFLLGIIWGVWHWPVIWMGYNYPGEPLWGSLLMLGYCIVLAFFLAYAVFKSKGVWTAAYLHALNNQTLSFFVVAVVAPTSAIFSFGMGLPGLALGVLAVLLLLRDPVWKVID